VVDDDARLRRLLQRYLSDSGFRVSTAGDAQEARSQIGGIAFDLVVLDVMMPGEDGLELTRALRQSGDLPILLLTAMSEAVDRIAGFEVGADDYLTKPFEPRELVLRVRSILRRSRDAAVPSQRVLLGEFVFDLSRGELRRGQQLVHLTTAETALLQILASNPGRTVSREELSSHASEGNPRAVDVQVTRLRRKIEPAPKAPRYLQTVWGRGYALWPD
jgi:two-component system, OmpR family, phosphate regulon response regulator OmpR